MLPIKLDGTLGSVELLKNRGFISDDILDSKAPSFYDIFLKLLQPVEVKHRVKNQTVHSYACQWNICAATSDFLWI